jgi:hypothetical protein
MMKDKCDGVLIRKTGEMIDCPKYPTYLTEELLSYCDSCYAEYEKAGRRLSDVK